MKKKYNFFFNNNLGVQGVITYFYGSFKQISIFLNVKKTVVLIKADKKLHDVFCF